MATDIRESEQMRFQLDPTPAETQRACAAILQASLPASRSTLIFAGLYVAVAMAAFALTPATRNTTTIIGIVAVLATAIALRLEGQSRVRRLRASDPHAEEIHHLELGPDGVRAWCDHVDARYPWRDFSRVVETKEFYLFVRPSGNGSALPKRLLGQAQVAELRARIQEWSPDRGAGLASEAR